MQHSSGLDVVVVLQTGYLNDQGEPESGDTKTIVLPIGQAGASDIESDHVNHRSNTTTLYVSLRQQHSYTRQDVVAPHIAISEPEENPNQQLDEVSFHFRFFRDF
jgi:hypothetical protein